MKYVLTLITAMICAVNLMAAEPTTEVIMISSESCAACIHWEQKDQPKIPGSLVVKVKKFPTYILVVDGKVKVLQPPDFILGYRSAEKLKEMVRRMRKKAGLMKVPVPSSQSSQ